MIVFYCDPSLCFFVVFFLTTFMYAYDIFFGLIDISLVAILLGKRPHWERVLSAIQYSQRGKSPLWESPHWERVLSESKESSLGKSPLRKSHLWERLLSERKESSLGKSPLREE